MSNFKKAGDVRTLYNVGGMKQVAIVSLGEQSVAQKDEQEAARRAVSRERRWAYMGMCTDVSL